MRNVTTNYAEESPFIDMINKSQAQSSFKFGQEFDQRGEQIKKNMPEPDFIIYKPTQKYDYKSVCVPNQQHEKIINKIISTVEKGISINLLNSDNQQLKSLIKNNKQIVQGYIRLDYPSCRYLGVIAANLGGDFTTQFPANKYKDIKQLEAKHKNYPPLLTAIGKQLFQNSRQDKKWQDYFDKAALQYGYAYAFVEYGIVLDKSQDKIKVFQMFKNAEHLGLVGIASFYLGKICYQGGRHVNMNLYKSLDYYKISEGLGVIFNKENQLPYDHVKSLFDPDSYSQKQVITTEQTEALVVSRFILIKFKEQQFFRETNQNVIQHTTTTGKPINAVFNTKPRVFYVVCSPYLKFPSRGFLAQERDTGFIQIINIYNWNKIPIAKLRLLHKLGTKVVLKSYLRKLSNYDRTPMYRVEDPNSVDIEQSSERKVISQSKYRNMGRLLFGTSHFELAIAVYRVLEDRGCSELEVVYSNTGLCHQKVNNIDMAIDFYRKSLRVKKYFKSELRLASLLIKRKQLQQANKIITNMQECQQKRQLLQQLNQQMNKEIEKTDLQFITFLKSKKRTARMTPYVYKQNILKQSLGWKQLQYGFRINRAQFESAIIKKTFSSDEQYIQKIKYYIVDFVEIPQSQISSKNQDIATFFHLIDYVKIAVYIVRSGVEPKQRTMMNRIQIYCQQRQIDGDIQQAINMLKVVGSRSLIMTIKLAQLLRKQNKIDQSIQACQNYLIRRDNSDLDGIFQYYYASLNLELIKSQIKAKKFTLNKCMEYLQKINVISTVQKAILAECQPNLQNFPDFKKLISDPSQMANFLNRAYRYSELISIKGYLFQNNWTPLSMKQQIYLQMAIALGKQRKFNDSFHYLSQVIINHSRKIHPGDVYYRAVIFKILLLQDNGQIKESIAETDRLIKILKQHEKNLENYKAYRKTLLQQKISSYLKQKNHEKIAQICEQIIQFSLQNYQFVVKKLSTFIFEDRSSVAARLVKLVESSNIINFLFEDLQAKLQVSTSSQQQILSLIEKSINKKDKMLKTSNKTQLIYQILDQQNLIQACKEFEDFKKNKQTGMDKFLDDLQEYEDMERDLQFGFEGIEGLIMHFYHPENYQHYAIIMSPELQQTHKQLKEFHRVINKLFTQKENQDELKNLGNKTIKIITSSYVYAGSMKNKNGVRCCIFNQCTAK